MRILVFNWRDINNPWAGGAEVNIHEQAKRWVGAGHSVTMLCGRFPRRRPCEGETVVDGVKIIRRGGKYSVYFWAALYYLRHLRGQHDVVVDVANGIPFFTPLYCRLPKVVIFHHIHLQQWFIELPWPLALGGWFLERVFVPMIYSRVSVVAVSESTRRDLEKLKMSPERIAVIHNGLDHAMYYPGKLEPNPNRLIYLGRMMRYKRLEILLRLMDDLKEQFPELVLDLVGGGERRNEIERLAANMEMDDRVRFHGYVDHTQKLALLHQAWLLVVPSIREGWGLTVLEANACGLPAVAYDVPGLNESIRDGETGLLGRDYDDLLANVRMLLVDHERRQQMAEAALRWSAQFDWAIGAQKLLGVLQSVCASPQPVDSEVPVIAP